MGKRLALASAAVLLVYLTLLTRSHYWDGVLFSLYVEKAAAGQMARSALFHPNHLLYSAAGFVLYDMFAALHPRAIVCFQVANALCGAAAASLVAWLAAGWTRSRSAAWFSLVFFSFGATWWKFSTDAGSYVPAVLFVLLAVRAAFGARWVEAAFYHAAAMLLHQLSVFAFLPLGFAIAVLAGRRRAAAYASLAAGFTAAAYLLVFYGAAFAAGPQSFFAWLTSFSGGARTTQTLAQALFTYPLSFGKLLFGGKLSLVRDFWSAPVAIGLLAAVLFLVLAFRWLRETRRVAAAPPLHPVVSKTLWLWIAPYAVFTLWFEPGNAFYKLFLWPPAVLLAALALERHAKAALAFSLAMACWNFSAFVYPHTQPSADPVYAFALRLHSELPPRAKILYRSFTPDDWYLAYFAPGRDWQAAPQGNLAPEAPFCLETSALAAPDLQHAALTSRRTWLLNDRRHYVRLECFENPR